ncbi:MAG: hypothetical protein LBQ14_02795 [Treponema sp.]|nr:hypothetical protein [Treponema sp.]
MKHLIEQVMREMAVYKLEAFVSLLFRRLEIAAAKSNQRLLTLDMITGILNYTRDNSHWTCSITRLVISQVSPKTWISLRNQRFLLFLSGCCSKTEVSEQLYSVNSPFAIKDNGNALLVPVEDYLACLQNAFPNQFAGLVNENELKPWAKNMVKQVKEKLKSSEQGSYNRTKIATGTGLIINEFAALYPALRTPKN